MSRTTRRHESRHSAAKRGPKNKHSGDPRAPLKSVAQKRSRARTSLRKEWL